MKHKRKAITLALAAVILTAGVTALASAGTSDNPLVTLSYLKDTFTQSILTQTQSKINAAQSTYEDKLEEKLQAASLGGGASSSSEVYQVVKLTRGQAVTGSTGCEVILREGSALCISTETPGLVDTTTGGSLEGGSSLEANHLYVVAASTASVKAPSSATVLVRGPYTVV